MLLTGPHLPATYLAAESTTVGDMFRRRAERSPAKPAIYEKRLGRWEPITWGELYDRARRIAAGLTALGLERGDRVAILGPTQLPWALYDMGSQLAGMVSFGIYPKQAVDQVRYLMSHSEARVVFVATVDELETVVSACEELEHVRAIVPWDHTDYLAWRGRDPRITSPKELDCEPLDNGIIASTQAAISSDDTAILVYTSGTTGPPKGAMITHGNILSLLSSQSNVVEFFEDDCVFSFLPMAHAAERVLAFFGRISSGATTAYATSVSSVLEELKEVRPTLFGSVPRIYEKAYAKIHSEVEKKPPLVQKIFAFAAAAAREAAPYHVADEPKPWKLALRWALADKLVLSKVRAAFGGRVRWSITGAAPIAVDILEFFWGAGIPIYEVYGMTEATVVTHTNRPGIVKLGTVGKIIDCLEQRIADDGEILIRGPFVFKGYYKDEAATAETIIDGWLHTGDIGRIDRDGFLRITDRKKHLIITAGGKNLSPANIENAIKNQDPLISQVHAHGDARPFVCALVAPSPIETLEFGLERGLVSGEELRRHTDELMANPASRSEELERAMRKVVSHADFEERVRAAVAAGNEELAQVEKVKRFAILDRDFSQEHGELTPTLKLKRKTVETKFSELFDRLYADEDFGLAV